MFTKSRRKQSGKVASREENGEEIKERTWDEIEQLALGEIGLTVDYFYSLTPRQWHNTEKGYYAKELILMKDRWIQTRKIMWAYLMPKVKNLKESEVVSFPWDVETAVEFTDEDNRALLDEVEKVKAFYDEVDAKKATAKSEKWNLKE